MAKTRAEIEAEFDALVAELGDPLPVTTKGPAKAPNGRQDLPAPPLLLVDKGDDGETVRTKRKAIEWGRDVVADQVDIFTGLCLMFVRMAFGIDPLYPDAITAWDESVRKHRVGVHKAARGHAGFFRGGDHGHVVLVLGDDRCISTDVRTAGQADVCRLSDIEAAWGYEFLGYTDDLNGETAPAPRPRPRQSGREWRMAFLRRALVHARSQGNMKRASMLRAWMDQLRARG